MNKIIRFIQNYLIIGLPFVIACVIWETISPGIENGKDYSPLAKMIWTGLGLNILLWFSMLILLLIALVIVPSVRDKTIRRLANIKERDEREQYITGKASRTTYIATLSAMIFFLFFSLFSFDITTIPKDQNDGHRFRASLGLHFSLLNNSDAKQPITKTPEKVVFDTKRYSLSSSTILLILLVWQLFVFNRAAKREQL